MNNMTKKGKILIIVVLFIIALIALFYIEKNSRIIPVVKNPVPEVINAVNYYCQEGILKVSYEKERAIVNFPDGKSLVFMQSISADGGRYEYGTMVFWSKGDNAFVTENDKQTYANCVTGDQVIAGDNIVYTDPGKTFSFSYPKTLSFSGGDGSYTTDWKVNTTILGLLFNVVRTPKEFISNTNFGDAKFTVGTSVDPVAIKNCLKAENGETVKAKKIVINGTTYTEIALGDAGAGNFYEITSYRTLHNDKCYVIEYIIHSTNIGNYSPDQGIKEFDKTKIISIFESIVQSFKFL